MPVYTRESGTNRIGPFHRLYNSNRVNCLVQPLPTARAVAGLSNPRPVISSGIRQRPLPPTLKFVASGGSMKISRQSRTRGGNNWEEGGASAKKSRSSRDPKITPCQYFEDPEAECIPENGYEEVRQTQPEEEGNLNKCVCRECYENSDVIDDDQLNSNDQQNEVNVEMEAADVGNTYYPNESEDCNLRNFLTTCEVTEEHFLTLDCGAMHKGYNEMGRGNTNGCPAMMLQYQTGASVPQIGGPHLAYRCRPHTNGSQRILCPFQQQQQQQQQQKIHHQVQGGVPQYLQCGCQQNQTHLQQQAYSQLPQQQGQQQQSYNMLQCDNQFMDSNHQQINHSNLMPPSQCLCPQNVNTLQHQLCAMLRQQQQQQQQQQHQQQQQQQHNQFLQCLCEQQEQDLILQAQNQWQMCHQDLAGSYKRNSMPEQEQQSQQQQQQELPTNSSKRNSAQLHQAASRQKSKSSCCCCCPLCHQSSKSENITTMEEEIQQENSLQSQRASNEVLSTLEPESHRQSQQLTMDEQIQSSSKRTTIEKQIHQGRSSTPSKRGSYSQSYRTSMEEQSQQENALQPKRTPQAERKTMEEQLQQESAERSPTSSRLSQAVDAPKSNTDFIPSMVEASQAQNPSQRTTLDNQNANHKGSMPSAPRSIIEVAEAEEVEEEDEEAEVGEVGEEEVEAEEDEEAAAVAEEAATEEEPTELQALESFNSLSDMKEQDLNESIADCQCLMSMAQKLKETLEKTKCELLEIEKKMYSVGCNNEMTNGNGCGCAHTSNGNDPTLIAGQCYVPICSQCLPSCYGEAMTVPCCPPRSSPCCPSKQFNDCNMSDGNKWQSPQQQQQQQQQPAQSQHSQLTHYYYPTCYRSVCHINQMRVMMPRYWKR